VSTLRTINIIHPSGSTTNVVNDSSGNITVGGGITSSSALDMGSSFKRNRILNGNMVIDQRNAGAAAGTSINGYTVDRWAVYQSVTGKLNAQQSAAVYPVGFVNSLSVTSQSAYSILATDFYAIQQPIEGVNISDLAWGTANAKTVTLSFQAYSSLTGTFGGSLRNSATNRSYPFTYTISSANTWTSVSITIAGDTSGTWLTTTGAGIYLSFGLGVGSTYSGTAGSWSSNNYISATGGTSVVGTNGATFFLTGVQLEVGTKATPYEMQIYSDQLAQCQRYYVLWKGIADATGYSFICNGVVQGSGTFFATISLPVTMRQTPFISYVGTITGSPNAGTLSGITTIYNQKGSTVGVYGTISVAGTVGYAFALYTYNDPTSYLYASAEL